MICPHCQQPMKATRDLSSRKPRLIWFCQSCRVEFDRKTEQELAMARSVPIAKQSVDLKIPGIDPGPATKKRPTPHEHIEQSNLFKSIRMYWERYPVLKSIFAVPNGGWRHKAIAGAMWAEGCMPGVPDVVCAVPVLPYSGLFIEMKVGNKTPTEHQEEWHQRLQENGYRVEVCYSWEAAWCLLINYLSLPIEEPKHVRRR